VTSILAVRDRLARLQEALSTDSRARNPVRLMRLAFERFLIDSWPGLPAYLFYSNRGELRGMLGVFLEQLANAYGQTANKPLLWIFPSTPVEQIEARSEPPGRYPGRFTWRVLRTRKMRASHAPHELTGEELWVSG
jgi:hypothetical protein